MDLLFIVYLFLVGLIFGSFYNVVGLRLPLGQSIVKPRSACPTCKRTLMPMELIPVLSYLLQGGKCKGCEERISPRYAIIELITGVLFVFCFVHFEFSGELVVALTFISLLMIITVSDIAYMLIPDKIVFFFGVLFIIERLIVPLRPWYDSLIGAVVGFVLLLLIAIGSRGGMGGGDIKLYAVLGYVLGWKLVLLSFLFATFFGAVIGGIGMAIGKVERKKPIPFGPFIVMGTILSYFYGDNLLNWYISIFI
ncbi:MAG: prepilin peptidase [Bacillaceae bacterium]